MDDSWHDRSDLASSGQRGLGPVDAVRIGPRDLMEPVQWSRPFTSYGWLFETKVDGVRTLARKQEGAISLLSRTGREMTAQFPEVISALAGIPGDWHLDAELMIPYEPGNPAHGRLRRRASMRREASIAAAAGADPAALCVFDILTLDRADLRDLTTRERKARLASAIPPTPVVQIVSSLEADGDAAFAMVCDLDLEGVVAKRVDARYRSGARPTWRKIKNPRYSRQKA